MRDSKIKIHEAMALVDTHQVSASFDADTSTVTVSSPYNPALVESLVTEGLGYFNESAKAWVFPLEAMQSVVQVYNEHYPNHDLPSALLMRTLDEADGADDNEDAASSVAISEIESMGAKAVSIYALSESYAQAVARLVQVMPIEAVAAAARDFGIYPLGWEDEVTKLNRLLPITHQLSKMAQEEKNKVVALQRFLNALEEAKFRGVYSRDVLNHLVKPAGLEVTKSPFNPNY